MEEYALYCYIRDIIKNITSDFVISHNDYDLNGNNIIGVVTSGGMTPEYRNLKSGEYYNYNTRMQLILQSSLDKDDLFKLLELLSKLRLIFSASCINQPTLIKDVVFKDGSLVRYSDQLEEYSDCILTISRTGMIGEARFRGKTSQGKPIYVMNYNINYYFEQGGVHNGS